MLTLSNVTIKTRQPIITKFSYIFSQGNIYGITAINGSGKTTFFRGVLGLIPIQAGEIFLDNKKISTSQVKRQFFYFENSNWLDGNLTGQDYLKYISKQWRSNYDSKKMIDYWGMADYIDLPIKKYSLGMKQKLLISLYVVSDASVMFMDEITNGLDEESREKLFSLLQEFKENGKTIIMTSHYIEEIKKICTVCLSLKNETMEEVE